MASYFVSSASGAGGAGNGSSWANAYLTVAGAIARPLVAGDTLLIGDDHSENVATNIVLNATTATAAAPVSLLCVDHTKPSPGAADLKVGVNGAGSLVCTTLGNIQFAGFMYVYGLFCNTGIGSVANSQGIFVPNGSKSAYFERCTFGINSTGLTVRHNVNTNSYVEFRNCTFTFNGSAGQGVALGQSGRTKYIGCTFSFTGTQPSALIYPTSGANVVFEGCDFGGYTGANLVSPIGGAAQNILFKDCKLPTSPAFDMTQTISNQNSVIWVINSDNANTNYRNEVYDYSGNLTTSLTVVRTGGASMGTAYAWKVATNANNCWALPFRATTISIWNTTIGSAVNVTVEGIADPRDFSALPNNDDIWFDVESLASATQPTGVTVNGTKASILGTNSALSASTAAWDSAATARANSTAYVLGNIYKVASNAGRLFVCTTAGTSAGTEPGGLATAVDGGAVTDGTAVFTAMWRFKQTLTTAAIQFAGSITVYPKVGKASLNGIYIDPVATLS